MDIYKLDFLVAKVGDTSLVIWEKKHSMRYWTSYHASGGNASRPVRKLELLPFG